MVRELTTTPLVCGVNDLLLISNKQVTPGRKRARSRRRSKPRRLAVGRSKCCSVLGRSECCLHKEMCPRKCLQHTLEGRGTPRSIEFSKAAEKYVIMMMCWVDSVVLPNSFHKIGWMWCHLAMRKNVSKCVTIACPFCNCGLQGKKLVLPRGIGWRRLSVHNHV